MLGSPFGTLRARTLDRFQNARATSWPGLLAVRHDWRPVSFADFHVRYRGLASWWASRIGALML